MDKFIQSTTLSPDWVTPWQTSTLGQLKNGLLEVVLHASRILQRRRQPRLVVFPCGTKHRNSASLLRAYSVGEMLKNHFGWRVTIVPPRFSLQQRLRILKLEQPDIVLMQMERHPLNRPRLYAPFPVIFDIDDADFLWEHAHDLVVECCRDSVEVIAGSHFVGEWASKYNFNVNVIWTGAASNSAESPPSQLERKNIVAWGHSRPFDYPKEAEFIEQVLVRVAQRLPVEYWIFGIKKGADSTTLTSRILKAGITVRTFEPMSFNAFSKHLERVAVGLQVLAPENLYSQGKSFGKILNYLTAGTVVVGSRGADHSMFFDSGRNGLLAESVDEWVDAIVWLLSNPNEREKIARQGYMDFQKRLSLTAVAAQYDKLFRLYIEKTSNAIANDAQNSL